MKTNMDCRTLGENKTNYTNSNVRQTNQSDLITEKNSSTRVDNSYSGLQGYENEERNRKSAKIGSSVKHDGISGGKIAASVIAGASVGVLAGILLAPEKGKDLRKQVANSASRIGDKVTKSFSSTKDKVNSWTGKSSKQNSSYSNITNQSSSEVNTMVNDPSLGPIGGSNMQRCL
jgi:gas vesicle protein